MTSRILWAAALGVALAACSETPLTPVRGTVPAAALATTTAVGARAPGAVAIPACTHRWASAVSGNWDDASKWSPNAVPDAGNVACIDAAGTYTVTLARASAAPVNLTALAIGGASGTASLELGAGFTAGPGNLTVAGDIAVAATGRLRLGRGTVIAGGTLGVTGTLGSIPGCCAGAQTITADVVNDGTIDIQQPVTFDKVDGSYVNNGTWNFGSSVTGTPINIPASSGSPTFQQNGGSITGAAPTAFEMRAGTFFYNGGTVGTRGGSQPIVRLINAALVIASPTLGPADFDMVSPSNGTVTLTGGIGPTQRVRFGGDDAGGSGTLHIAGTGVVIDGIIESAPFAFTSTNDRYFTSDAPVTIGSTGQFKLTGSGDFTHLHLDLVNDGSIDLRSQLIVDGSGKVFTNNGSIPNHAFLVYVRDHGRLHNGSTGDVQSTVYAEQDGVVTGGGNFGALHIWGGGAVSPGDPAGNRYGVMHATSFASLAVDAVLQMDVGGTLPGSTHDQIDVDGQLVMDGILNIIEMPGFAAGACGQVVYLIKDNSPGGRGQYDFINGLFPSSGGGWRVWDYRSPAGITPVSAHLALVGFDPQPSAKMSLYPDPVGVAEGGVTADYAVCVQQQPTAPVTVTASPDAQVTVQPASVQFTPSDWITPKFLTVTAVDDQAVEGPHTGAVNHSVNTTDPFYVGYNLGTLDVDIADNDAAPTSADLRIVAGAKVGQQGGKTYAGFRANVRNNGPSMSPGATLTVTPGPGLTFAKAQGATCVRSGRNAVCTLGAIANGATVVVDLAFRALQSGSVTTTLAIAGQLPDPVGGNNSARKTVTLP